MAILHWSQQTGVEWHYIAPGKTPETLSSPLVVQFQLRPDPLAH